MQYLSDLLPSAAWLHRNSNKIVAFVFGFVFPMVLAGMFVLAYQGAASGGSSIPVYPIN